MHAIVFHNEIWLPLIRVEESAALIRKHGEQVSKYKLAAAHYSWIGQSPSYGTAI